MIFTLSTIVYTLLAALAWPLVSMVLGAWKQWRVLRALPAPPASSWLWGHANEFLTTKAPLKMAEW